MDTRKQNRPEPWDDSIYGTGNTRPPKSNGGLIALLLIIIIFLSGIASALGILNMRLFHELNARNELTSVPMSFSDEGAAVEEYFGPEDLLGTAAASLPRENACGSTSLGLEGEEITTFYQNYYRMPPGLYITEVADEGAAEDAGIRPGDILLELEDCPILTMEDLNRVVYDHENGDSLTAVILREGQQYSLTLTLEESQD